PGASGRPAPPWPLSPAGSVINCGQQRPGRPRGLRACAPGRRDLPVTDASNSDGSTRLPARMRDPGARVAGASLLRKLLAYRFVLASALLLLFVAIASLPSHLPIGGLEALAEGTGFTGSEPPPLPEPDRL